MYAQTDLTLKMQKVPDVSWYRAVYPVYARSHMTTFTKLRYAHVHDIPTRTTWSAPEYLPFPYARCLSR